VEVADGQDVPLLLAITVAIDALASDEPELGTCHRLYDAALHGVAA
jgi:hypothetical protein